MGSGEVILGMRPQNIDEIISAIISPSEKNRDHSALTNNTIKGSITKVQTKTQSMERRSKCDEKKSFHEEPCTQNSKLNVTIMNTILQNNA